MTAKLKNRDKNTSSERKLSAKRRIRLSAALVTLVIITAFAVLGKQREVLNLIGMFVSWLLVAVVLFRFPLYINIAAFAFLIGAAAGSILGWYSQFYYLDKLLHCASGIILACIGRNIANEYFKRKAIEASDAPGLVFAGIFSAAGAGVWEMIEFLGDQLFRMTAQRGLTDTMTDIFAGVAGGLFTILFWLLRKGSPRKYVSNHSTPSEGVNLKESDLKENLKKT